MLSGHGGIGRRVRLRGVWLHRPSSSLGDRTNKEKKRTKRFVFFLCVRVIETCVQLVARRIYAQLGLRPTNAPLWRVNSPRFAITLVSLATSLGRPQAKRDASAQHLRKSSAVDIASKCNTKCCVRTHAGAIAPFAKRRPHQQKDKHELFVLFLFLRTPNLNSPCKLNNLQATMLALLGRAPSVARD